MTARPGSGRFLRAGTGGPTRATLQVAAIVVVVLTILSAGFFLPTTTSSAAGASAGGSKGSALTGPQPASSSFSRTLGGSLSVGVTAVNVSEPPAAFSNIPANDFACNTGGSPCFNNSADPSVVTLANGNPGLGFDISDDASTNDCPYAGVNVTWQVAFATSSDGGQTFGAPHLIDNQTCPYIDAIEPWFAASGGSVYGVFIEANFSASYGTSSGPFPLSNWYDAPDQDAIGFLTISHDGTVFSPIRTLTQAGTGWLGRPVLAAFGQSLYLVYTQVDNATTLPSTVNCDTPCWPLTLEFMNSSNEGATWTGPTPLPAFNSSFMNTSMGASIAVNRTGTIAVSYATNLSCDAWCLNGVPQIASDIVTALSTNNGTSWAMKTVSPYEAGRSYLPLDYNDQVVPMILLEPQTSTAWTPANELVVGWAAGYNQSYALPAALCEGGVSSCYQSSGAWVGTSHNLGSTWSISNLTTNSGPAPLGSEFFGGDYNLALTAPADGDISVSFTYFNGSAGAGIFGEPCTLFSALPIPSFSQYLSETTDDGTQWSQLVVVSTLDSQDEVYFGTSGALTPPDAGVTASFYVIPGESNAGFTAPLAEALSAPVTSAFASLTVKEANLPPGSTWNAAVTGSEFDPINVSTTDTTIIFTGIPVYSSAVISDDIVGPFGWLEYVPLLPGSGVTTVAPHGTTVTVDFAKFYGIGFSLDVNSLPGSTTGSDYLAILSLGIYEDVEWLYIQNFVGEISTTVCPFPWFVPAGVTIPITPNTNLVAFAPTIYIGSTAFPISFWQGSGPGNFTGPATAANVTLGGPVNESGLLGSYGNNFSEGFSPAGLPSSSTYQFIFNGTPYSSSALENVTVQPLSTGAYTISQIEASATTPGWEYFGTSEAGNPVAVPVFVNDSLNFSALVHVAEAPGTVTFQAVGLGEGTPWQLEVNGTTYNATGPFLNASLKAGTYPIASFPAVALNDSVAFTPSLSSSTISVTPGDTYPIEFQNAYRVSAVGSAGGLVAGAGNHWVASGGMQSFEAIPLATYTFAGWEGTGPGSYTGAGAWANVTVTSGPITETATFFGLPLDRFYLNFTESGIPPGTFWTVYADGAGYSSDTGTLSVPGLYSCHENRTLGTYAVLVPFAYASSNGTRFVPGAYPGSICGGSTVPLTFQPEFHISALSSPGGSVFVRVNTTSEPDEFWLESGADATFSIVTANGFYFAGWTGNGTGSYSGMSGTIDVLAGGPVTEVANFQPILHPPAARYAVDLHDTSNLASGTSWSVVLNGSSYSSTRAWLNVSGFLPGVYSLRVGSSVSPDGLTEYTPVGVLTNLTVANTNLSEAVGFAPSYWVSVSSVGVGTVGPSSAFYRSGTTVTLSAVPAGGMVFRAWTGTGTGAYSGTNPNATVLLTGPVIEVASFTAPTPVAATASTNFLGTPTSWAIFALLGIAAGVGVGWVVARRRRATEDPPSDGESGPGSGSAEP
jgi:List-Bact-rpt repeat protein